MSNIVTQVFGVFSEVAGWFVQTLPTLTEIFYDTAANSGEGGLTLLGVLAVAGLGISVSLLLFNWVKDLLTFRG